MNELNLFAVTIEDLKRFLLSSMRTKWENVVRGSGKAHLGVI